MVKKVKNIKNHKKVTIALVGNQNSGKTSLFNRLVGANQKVGNWPGVTVEKYEGIKIYQGYELCFIDLPGIYSLNPYTMEERISRDYILESKPDIILNIIDSTNLDRNLYLTTQLLEINVPIIGVLNIYDEIKNLGIDIDIKCLNELFGMDFIPTSAKNGFGSVEILSTIIEKKNNPLSQENKFYHYQDIETEIEKLKQIIEKDQKLIKKYSSYWLALRLLEKDEKTYRLFHDRPLWLSLEKQLIQSMDNLEKHYEQDIKTSLVESRYAFIRGALQEAIYHSKKKHTSRSHIIDNILINRFFGLPFFFLIMWLLFHLTFSLGQIPMGWLEKLFNGLGEYFNNLVPAGLLRSLIVDGIIAGVGGVLVFVPNILILFFGISVLEGSGYMARAAFVVDKAMHKIGLHGRSFIPMIIGFGCSVPAFMACRTLKDKADRLTTMLVIPFISCSAKLPVYVLLISAFFPKSYAGNILFGIYLFGIFVAVLMAKLLKLFVFKGKSEPFVMELPPYRFPSLKNIIIHTWEKIVLYLRKAGTVLLFFAVVIWFMSNFPVNPEFKNTYENRIRLITYNQTFSERQKVIEINKLKNQQGSEQLAYSLAGRLGRFIEPAIKPLGFNWEIGVALVAGFAAKEVVVSTLSTIYALHGAESLSESLIKNGKIKPLTALSLMIFVLLYVPCVAATTVFHKEAGSWKWTWFYIFFTTGTAYFFSFVVYQSGKLLGY